MLGHALRVGPGPPGSLLRSTVQPDLKKILAGQVEARFLQAGKLGNRIRRVAKFAIEVPAPTVDGHASPWPIVTHVDCFSTASSAIPLGGNIAIHASNDNRLQQVILPDTLQSPST